MYNTQITIKLNNHRCRKVTWCYKKKNSISGQLNLNNVPRYTQDSNNADFKILRNIIGADLWPPKFNGRVDVWIVKN